VGLSTQDPVWYLAYGSNMAADRFSCYLAGGVPPGAERSYEGCRDRTPPVRDVGLRVPGLLRFGGVSGVWGGALAFYDREADGWLAARAYLITFGQFSDVVAQEARQPVSADLTSAGNGTWKPLSAVYESISQVGTREGAPILSFTSARVREPAAPSAPYLRTILRGLRETFGWSPEDSAEYLLQAPGVALSWSSESLAHLANSNGV
jgi:hypothetical protein